MLNVVDRKYHADSKVFNNIYIVPDIRIFTLYALFNGIYDYHDEYAEEMSAEHIELIVDIQRAAAGVDGRTVQRWKKYFAAHKIHIWSYIYYTSFCQLPPGFEFNLDAATKCSKKLADLKDFNEILADFYAKCGIEKLYFEKYKALLLEYINRYDEKHILSIINYVHRYLKIPIPDGNSMDIVIVPIPFESHFMGYGAPQKNKLYLFESTGAQNRGLNIHEYLHAFVNPAVESVSDLSSYPIAEVFIEQREKEWILSDYGELHTFVAENFVRAITYRIFEHLYGIQNFCFDELSQFGLVLVKPLYTKLKEEFEAQSEDYKDINQFIHTILTQ